MYSTYIEVDLAFFEIQHVLSDNVYYQSISVSRHTATAIYENKQSLHSNTNDQKAGKLVKALESRQMAKCRGSTRYQLNSSRGLATGLYWTLDVNSITAVVITPTRSGHSVIVH